jgi:DNA-binding beta-propeller fold protein YncE
MRDRIHLISAVMALTFLMYPPASEGQEEYVFVRSWPSDGTGLGYPKGVAVDGSGNVYVADTFNYRVQKFTSEGVFLTKWGRLGSDERNLDSPGSIAVDGSGNVYVTDTNNDRIQKFSSRGSFLTNWGTEGSDDGQFDYPCGIAVYGSGNVCVVDTLNNRIQKFTSDGLFITKRGMHGVGGMGLSYPYGIAVSNSGVVYVADTGNQCIKVYRPVGGGVVLPQQKQIATWGKVKQTELYQNYPNPFNPETWIPYQLAEDADVSIRIYTAAGQLVRILNPGHKLAGFYATKGEAAYWDGRNDDGEPVTSGLYFYTMEADDFAVTKKMAIAD